MSWGASFVGLGSTLSMLNRVQTSLEGNAVYVVGTNVEYSVHVEFGTSKMDAQPWLRPAVREVEQELPVIAERFDTMDAIVKAAALEVERKARQKVPVDTGNLKASIRTERIR